MATARQWDQVANGWRNGSATEALEACILELEGRTALMAADSRDQVRELRDRLAALEERGREMDSHRHWESDGSAKTEQPNLSFPSPPAPTTAEAECRHPWVRHEYLWAETLGPYGVRCLDCRAVAIYQWLPLSKQTMVHPMRMT